MLDLRIILSFFLLFSSVSATFYELSNEPIDVVIPCHEKDTDLLEECIRGIRENGENIRRVIVISKEKLSDNAEFFSEENFPFSKEEIKKYILNGKNPPVKVQKQLSNRLGWVFQQLIKLYSPFIIPGVSENVLLLDADTIFLKSVKFTDSITNSGLFDVGSHNHKAYFRHAKRLIPNFRKIHKKHSGICNHMLMQKTVLDHLFSEVEQIHQEPFWIAFCKKILPQDWSGCSEYEIYFNFAQMHSNQFSVRRLSWKNSKMLNFEEDKKHYHYVSYHEWMREK